MKKVDKLQAGLCSLVLIVILAGCHHKPTPAAPISEAPPKIVSPSPTASLKAVPESVERGESVELTWNTQNATEVTIEGIGAVSGSGSQKITPQSSTTYHLTATGDGGTADASARVTVNIPVAKVPELTGAQLFAQNVHDVFFDYDKYDVRPDEVQTATANAAFLARHIEINLIIAGHCDERGSDEYNLGLGENRASAIRDWLVANGVSADRIRIVSYGKERPFCTTAEDEDCWSQNRRAHFVFDGQTTASR